MRVGLSSTSPCRRPTGWTPSNTAESTVFLRTTLDSGSPNGDGSEVQISLPRDYRKPFNSSESIAFLRNPLHPRSSKGGGSRSPCCGTTRPHPTPRKQWFSSVIPYSPALLMEQDLRSKSPCRGITGPHPTPQKQWFSK